MDSYDSIESKLRLRKIKVASYSVKCTANVILRSRGGILSKCERRFKDVSEVQSFVSIVVKFTTRLAQSILEFWGTFVSTIVSQRYILLKRICKLSGATFSHLVRYFDEGKRSLPTKVTDENEEIARRILHLPKWKCRDYSETVDRFPGCARRPPLEKSIFTMTTKVAALIPLSPLQIYNIHIRPTRLDFGKVSVKKSTFKI